ncbi:hypothetical protein C1645_832866 [Glomus cerebriforme]|uniref:Uncharacterized protein n=1 Tax=Glomus cerebriforme TaxID=658196 RepID=A0A397SDG4_9GLOM|nr:hypothetical protein C1645_832866 [Glomus cerebriforme]
MGKRSSNGSSFKLKNGFSVFSLILESRNWFSELFSPDWEEKMSGMGREISSLYFQFDTGIGNSSLSFWINSSLIRVLGFRKRLEIWFAKKLKHSALRIWNQKRNFASVN